MSVPASVPNRSGRRLLPLFSQSGIGNWASYSSNSTTSPIIWVAVSAGESNPSAMWGFSCGRNQRRCTCLKRATDGYGNRGCCCNAENLISHRVGGKRLWVSEIGLPPSKLLQHLHRRRHAESLIQVIPVIQQRPLIFPLVQSEIRNRESYSSNSTTSPIFAPRPFFLLPITCCLRVLPIRIQLRYQEHTSILSLQDWDHLPSIIQTYSRQCAGLE